MIKTYRFPILLPEEKTQERIKLLKNSFTDEQLKVLKELGASVVIEAEDGDGKKSFSIIDSDESEKLRHAKISEKGYAALTGDRDFLRRKAYVYNQVEKIKRIKESPNTPYRKLTDLIVKLSYDYDSRNLGELKVILPEIRKRFSNSRVDEIVVEFILTIAESDVKQGVRRSMQQWYETIIAIADKWQPEGEEKKRLQEENVSLQKQLRTMTKELGELKEKIRNDLATIRRELYSSPRAFKATPGKKGYWELISYQEEIVSRDMRIKELEEENSRLKAIKTEDAFVEKMLKETKKRFKHKSERNKAVAVSQILAWAGRDDASENLDEWLEGKEKPFIAVNGDFVVSKHVENEVDSVEAGGTGVSINKEEE